MLGSQFLWASVGGNVLLFAASALLYNSNVDLNVVKGKQDTQIVSLGKSTAQYRTQVEQCVAGTKVLIVKHKQEIDQYQAESLRMALANKGKIDALLEERGRLEGILRGMKKAPTTGASPAADRVSAIDAEIDKYIEELQR